MYSHGKKYHNFDEIIMDNFCPCYSIYLPIAISSPLSLTPHLNGVENVQAVWSELGLPVAWAAAVGLALNTVPQILTKILMNTSQFRF